MSTSVSEAELRWPEGRDDFEDCEFSFSETEAFFGGFDDCKLSFLETEALAVFRLHDFLETESFFGAFPDLKLSLEGLLENCSSDSSKQRFGMATVVITGELAYCGTLVPATAASSSYTSLRSEMKWSASSGI